MTKYLAAIVPETRTQEYGFHKVYEVWTAEDTEKESASVSVEFEPISENEVKKLGECMSNFATLHIVTKMQQKYWEKITKDCQIGAWEEDGAENRLRMALKNVFWAVREAEVKRWQD